MAKDTTPSGSPIYRHAPRSKPFELATAGDHVEHIGRHVEQHVGRVENVFHELVSDLVHVDVHIVPPGEGRPFFTLVTSGMSDRPMNAPPAMAQFRYAELMLCLPADWPLPWTAASWDDADPRAFWPVHLLKTLARLPHEYDTWLGFGHTVPNGDPMQPYAPGTKLCGAMLAYPVLTPAEFVELPLDADRAIAFYSVVPLFKQEVEFKLKKGAEALAEKLGKAGVSELLDVDRKNTCKSGWWPFG